MTTMRCDNCDNLYREVAELADEVAFWAYQAKWYYAKLHFNREFDDLPRASQRAVEAAFDGARIAENRSRYDPEPPRDIGGT